MHTAGLCVSCPWIWVTSYFVYAGVFIGICHVPTLSFILFNKTFLVPSLHLIYSHVFPWASKFHGISYKPILKSKIQQTWPFCTEGCVAYLLFLFFLKPPVSLWLLCHLNKEEMFSQISDSAYVRKEYSKTHLIIYEQCAFDGKLWWIVLEDVPS